MDGSGGSGLDGSGGSGLDGSCFSIATRTTSSDIGLRSPHVRIMRLNTSSALPPYPPTRSGSSRSAIWNSATSFSHIMSPNACSSSSGWRCPILHCRMEPSLSGSHTSLYFSRMPTSIPPSASLMASFSTRTSAGFRFEPMSRRTRRTASSLRIDSESLPLPAGRTNTKAFWFTRRLFGLTFATTPLQYSRSASLSMTSCSPATSSMRVWCSGHTYTLRNLEPAPFSSMPRSSASASPSLTLCIARSMCLFMFSMCVNRNMLSSVRSR